MSYEYEEAAERYYANLQTERELGARQNQYSAIADQTIKIGKRIGVQVDDDCIDVVYQVLQTIGKIDEFLKLEE